MKKIIAFIFGKNNIIDTPLYIGKIVISFSTHGCQGTIHEFEWIGVINGSYMADHGRHLMYKVKVLKDKSGELRDNRLIREEEKVLAIGLQELGGNFYINYN